MNTKTNLTEKAIQEAKNLLEQFSLTINEPEDFRLDARVSKDNLLDVVKVLMDNRWGYLSTITGLDHPGADEPKSEEKQWQRVSAGDFQDGLLEGQIELLYHFCNGAAVLSLRVNLPYSDTKVASVCELIPTATFNEREVSEMFGVTFTNSPDDSHLLLPDDWPANTYPLRKSFTGLTDAQKKLVNRREE